MIYKVYLFDGLFLGWTNFPLFLVLNQQSIRERFVNCETLFKRMIKTRMQSSRMRTAHSLTVSRRILCMHPQPHMPLRNHASPTNMHAPSNHTCPPATMHAHPLQPHMPPCKPCMTPQQPRMPPSNHTHTPATTHTHPPVAMHVPRHPGNHAHPLATTHAPQQPRTPPCE